MCRVVVNYADYGLQFFTTDGVFFVEMNLGVGNPVHIRSHRDLLILAGPNRNDQKCELAPV